VLVVLDLDSKVFYFYVLIDYSSRSAANGPVNITNMFLDTICLGTSSKHIKRLPQLKLMVA
jgi:hypothetical protein